MILFSSLNAFSLPEGWNVVEGEVTVDNSTPNSLVITASDHAIIDFTSFSIAENELVQFVQPLDSASVLSRVTGSSGSEIFGSLYANGQLVLINPNGIHFASTADVQVASLIASTLDIQNAMYLADQLTFEKAAGSGAGSILNEAGIEVAQGGHLIFLSEAIENQGTLTAYLGQVILGVGQKQTLSFDAFGMINLVIDEGVASYGGTPLLQNFGSISTHGGKILLSAKMLDQVLDTLINVEGIVQANKAVGKAGKVEFIASGGGINLNATVLAQGGQGTISATASGNLKVKGVYHAPQGTVTFDAGKNLEVTGATETQGDTTFKAKENLEVKANVTTEDGNLAFIADSDQDGEGDFLQTQGTTLKTTGFGDISISASGDSTLANIESAGSILLYASGPSVTYTQQTNSIVTAGVSFTISENVTISTSNTIYEVTKDWENQGVFLPELSVVKLVGLEESVVYGNNIFYDLTVIAPEKTVSFEAGKTQEVVGTLTMQGSYGKLLTLRSTMNGAAWNISVLGEYMIEYAQIQDSSNIHIHGPPLSAALSKNSLGNSGWEFASLLFTGSAGTKNYSDPNNWQAGFVPGSGDTVLLSGLSLTDVVLDTDQTIDSLIVEQGYSHTLILNNDLTLSGDWVHRGGVIDAGTSTVTFIDSSKSSQVLGDNTFYNFSVLTPEKVIQFEAGATQTILGTWHIQGAYGQHVRLVSTVAGERWMVNPSGIRDLTYTWVEDSHNLHPDIVIMTESTNRGNSIHWDPTGTWTNGAANGLISDAGNWSGLGGASPGAGDDLLFNGTSTASATWNAGATGTINSITLAAGYTGTVTLARTLVITTTLSIASGSGNFDAAGFAVTVTGLATITGGTYFAGSGTNTFDGGLTINGGTFNGQTANVDVNGVVTMTSGTLTAPSATGSFTVSDDFLITGGTFTHSSGEVTLDTTTTATLNAPAGGLTFWDLTITTAGKTVLWTAGDTFNIAAPTTWTVTGAVLASTVPGSQWFVNPTAFSISDVTVTDSCNLTATSINAGGNSINGGNNTRWSFPSGSSSSSPSTEGVLELGEAGSPSTKTFVDAEEDENGPGTARRFFGLFDTYVFLKEGIVAVTVDGKDHVIYEGEAIGVEKNKKVHLFPRGLYVSVAGGVQIFRAKVHTHLKDFHWKQTPSALSASKDGTQVYALLPDSGQLASIDTFSFEARKDAASLLGDYAIDVLPDPQGKMAYVTYALSDKTEVIELSSGNVLKTFSTGSSPSKTAITQDSRTLFVANQLDNTISKINTETSEHETIKMKGAPYGLALSKNDRELFVADFENGVVRIFDTQKGFEKARIETGKNPYWLEVSPDGKTLFVSNRGSDTVTVINIPTRKEIAQIPVGKRPAGMVLTPEGHRLYVANELSGNISVVDTTQAKPVIMETISEGVGMGPSRLALSTRQNESNMLQGGLK